MLAGTHQVEQLLGVVQGWPASRGPLGDKRCSCRLGGYLGAGPRESGLHAGKCMAALSLQMSAQTFSSRILGVSINYGPWPSLVWCGAALGQECVGECVPVSM